MYPRELALPQRSFFLFGPRGTGKTTWLRSVLPSAHWVDLLVDRELIRLMRQPGRFTQEVEALPAGTWVVVDEVQKLPPILNEVQDLITRRGPRYRFALTGSSARKLKRGHANLLPGRLINRKFFPLTAAEIGDDFSIDGVLRFGTLPAVIAESGGDGARIDLLEAYAENYLTQEIRQEAVVKQLDSFTRFLEVAAVMNAEVVNVAGIARDAAVARPTVQGYFEILTDTLIGAWLPAWRPRAKVKELRHSKFYFFDAGAVRALAGRLREPLGAEERGHLLETYVLHELRAYLNRSGCGGQLAYWRTPAGSEVDFVWTRADSAVGIEVKAATRWRQGDGAALKHLAEEKHLKRAFGVYLGREPLRDGAALILPLREFLDRLAAGAVIG
ncbi:MAG: ATP-binding protein [Deltaproteobacteria bacterium]|nr:ATP-binding protein [Deltaproteobacteria bacterium]